MTKIAEKNFLGLEIYEADDDEPYMNSQQQQHFSQVLSFWYRSLLSEVDTVVDSLQNEVGGLDQIDRAAYEERHRMELRTSDRRRRLQSKIEKAMLRIKRGEYGFCKSCGG